MQHSLPVMRAMVIGALVVSTIGARPLGEAARGVVANHVIVVSIDGLRPDAIEAYGARTLQRLMREGAYTLAAQTILPTKTLPSHASMLTGVTPAVHGITWNSNQTSAHGTIQVATVFEVAKQRGFTTAAFFSKSKLWHLNRPGTLDHVQAPSGLDVWEATRTVADATRYIGREQPNLTFVHIAEPDFAGHTFGWMSFAYRWAVRRADAGVEQLLKQAEATFGAGNYTIIVTADHGGHGRDHGSDHTDDMTIPWITWGAGVHGGTVLADSVRTMDTAATVLWLLGVNEPPSWTGNAVALAYTPAARLAVAQQLAARE